MKGTRLKWRCLLFWCTLSCFDPIVFEVMASVCCKHCSMMVVISSRCWVRIIHNVNCFFNLQHDYKQWICCIGPQCYKLKVIIPNPCKSYFLPTFYQHNFIAFTSINAWCNQSQNLGFKLFILNPHEYLHPCQYVNWWCLWSNYWKSSWMHVSKGVVKSCL